MRCAPCHAVDRLLQLRRRVLVWPSLPRRRLVRLDPHLKDPSHLFRRQYRALLRLRFASWTGPSAAPSRKQSANREPRVQHTHGGVDEQHGAVHRHKTVLVRTQFRATHMVVLPRYTCASHHRKIGDNAKSADKRHPGLPARTRTRGAPPDAAHARKQDPCGQSQDGSPATECVRHTCTQSCCRFCHERPATIFGSSACAQLARRHSKALQSC